MIANNPSQAYTTDEQNAQNQEQISQNPSTDDSENTPHTQTQATHASDEEKGVSAETGMAKDADTDASKDTPADADTDPDTDAQAHDGHADRVIDEESKHSRDETALLIPITENVFAYRLCHESPIRYLNALETVREYDPHLKTYLAMTDPNTHLLPLGGLWLFLMFTIPLSGQNNTLEDAFLVWVALAVVHVSSTAWQMMKLRKQTCFNEKTVEQNLTLYKMARQHAKTLDITW